MRNKQDGTLKHARNHQGIVPLPQEDPPVEVVQPLAAVAAILHHMEAQVVTAQAATLLVLAPAALTGEVVAGLVLLGGSERKASKGSGNWMKKYVMQL